LAIAITRYMSSTSARVRPTRSSTAGLSTPSTCRLRMNTRMAIMRSSARATGSSSPAVSRLARYFSGMRRLRTSGSSPFMPISPACARDCTGDSGGMYQTIGSVRYSGCSGSATRQSTAIL
jgi:hypothetical protein